jgi:FkbM family methyltransferase
VKVVPIRYFGQTVNLPDLPEYRAFYRKLEAGSWEPNTFRVLGENLDRTTVYIDIGGWIGVTPLWASHLAKQVIIVEPDPKCRDILGELCPAYPNVTVLDCAFSSEPSVLLHAIDGFGSSESTALDLGSGGVLEVPAIDVDGIMRHVSGEQVFVKIDIEGYEYRIRGEIARFSGYKLRGLQCAVHPQLYERCLKGNWLARRFATLAATAGFVRLERGLRAAPFPSKYGSMFSYLVFGVLFRAVPRGTDLIFCPLGRKAK